MLKTCTWNAPCPPPTTEIQVDTPHPGPTNIPSFLLFWALATSDLPMSARVREPHGKKERPPHVKSVPQNRHQTHQKIPSPQIFSSNLSQRCLLWKNSELTIGHGASPGLEGGSHKLGLHVLRSTLTPVLMIEVDSATFDFINPYYSPLYLGGLSTVRIFWEASHGSGYCSDIPVGFGNEGWLL